MQPLQDVHSLSCLVIWSTAFIMLLIIGYNVYVMQIGAKKIFPGSGAPISMAQAILSSIQSTSQFLFGVFIISLLLIMIIQQIIESNIAIPIITSVIGFLIGKSPQNPTRPDGKKTGSTKNGNSTVT